MLLGCRVGFDRRKRWRAVALLVVVASGAAACGSGDGEGEGEGGGGRGWDTGRVMAKTERGYCVSPDRGATTNCVPLDQADEEAEVGQCVRITDAPTPAEVRLSIVDEAACAAGDLGD